MEEIYILTRFPNKEMTAQEYIVFSKDILQKLQAFSPLFKTLYAWGTSATAGRYLKEDLSDFEQVVFEQLVDDERAFINPDTTNKNLTLNSKWYSGYSNSYSTDKDYKKEQITVSISAGSNDLDNAGILNFEFSNKLQPKLSLQKMMELMEFCIELVNPYFITTSSFEFRKKTNEESQDYKIGWINYFKDKQVKDLLPKDIKNKAFNNGGVLFWLSEEVALSTNQLAIEKAKSIQEILLPKGLLKHDNTIKEPLPKLPIGRSVFDGMSDEEIHGKEK